MKYILAHETARQRAVQAVKDAPDGYLVKVTPPGRTVSQNDLTHGMYEDIASALKEDDALGWKCYCKLHHGVPILRAEDEEYKAFYDKAIKGLQYEQKLAAMKFIPVTSLMNKKQLSKYVEAVKGDFVGRVQFMEAV